MITVEMVQAAVKKNGFGLCQYHAFRYGPNEIDGRNAERPYFACPLGQLYYAQHQCLPTEDKGIAYWVDEKFGHDYVTGFYTGFDNQMSKEEPSVEYSKGYDDGMIVRKFFGFN